jgi:hypothetical protein
MRRFLSLAINLLIFVLLLSSFILPQQSRAQIDASANAYYQAYSAAHQNTINGYHQHVPQDQFNALLQQEIAAWQNYVQAQNLANAEAYRLGTVAQQIAVIDATINNWIQYIQSLYNHRNLGAYANNPNYRAAFDQWVNQESARGNQYIVQLHETRKVLAGSTTSVVLSDQPIPSAPATSCDRSIPHWCDLIERR